MDLIFSDDSKIKLFAQIQDCLALLESNSKDEPIDLIIQQIPKSYLDQQDDLMIICTIFAYYGRNNIKNRIGNTVKLFKKIMDPIKKHLQNESTFIWNIFGSIYYLKLFMYKEGLISIEYIIQRALSDDTFMIAKYFSPEIKEKEPEIFEKEFKEKIQPQFTEEYINEFKELRNKHFKWLCESNDFNDPIYREIEKNQLRLAIKTDDIDSFQSILSNSNIPINSKIQESILENVYYDPHEVSLIDFAIDFNAIKIFKYLYMNDAKIKTQSVFNSISNRNYEIIHLIESKNKEKFQKNCLIDSIQCWNSELTKYSIDNYNDEFEDEKEIDSNEYKSIIEIIYFTCYSVNFQFFDTILLPFLKKNPKFVHEKIHEIIEVTIKDNSCFFMKEFLKYPEIDINYSLTNFDYEEDDDDDEEPNETFLTFAIKNNNKKAIEILFNNPNIDISIQENNNLLPFYIALFYFSDLSVLDMFFNHPKFDIDEVDYYFNYRTFHAAAIGNNFYAVKHILKKFPDYEEPDADCILYTCLEKNYKITTEIVFKFILNSIKDLSGEQIIEELKSKFMQLIGYKEEYIDQLNKILHKV